MVEKVCVVCGSLSPHQGNGLCHTCYQREIYNSNLKYREQKKQRMREYQEDKSIKSGCYGNLNSLFRIFNGV